jgi:hypothetical protein
LGMIDPGSRTRNTSAGECGMRRLLCCLGRLPVIVYHDKHFGKLQKVGHFFSWRAGSFNPLTL